MKKTDDQLAAFILQRSHWTNRKLLKSLKGVSVAKLEAVRKKFSIPYAPDTGPVSATKNPASRRVRGFTRRDFLTTFDHDERTRSSIRQGIKSLTNKDQILDEAEFRQSRCKGAHTVRFRTIASEPEFKDYQFSASNKIYWAHPETVVWAHQNVEGVKKV